MNHLTKLLTKLGNVSRNQSSKSSARNRLGNRLRLERLEERALMAVVGARSAENNAADSVGANHGTLANGTTFAPGQVGQAFKIDGINDRINLTDSSSLKLTQSLTIEGWIKVTSFPTSDHGEIFFRGDDRGGLDPYSLATEPGGLLRFQITNQSNTGVSIQAPVVTGEFIHVAATLDDATGAMMLYQNGTLVAQTTTSVRPFGDLDSASNPGIGIGNHGGYPATPHNFPFNGLIDELKVHDQALSASDVLAIYNASPASAPSLSISDVVTVEGDIHFGPYLGDLVAQNGGGSLNRSTGMAFGPDGNLYVASLNSSEVLRYDGASGAFIGTFIASNSGGMSGPAVDGLHFRPDGKLYILSRDNSSVLRFDANTGAFLNVFVPSGSGGLSSPKAMVFGPDGNLYISSGDQVLRFNGISGAYLGTFVATGSGGLSGARSLAFGPDGNLYVASVTNHSVLRYNGTTGAFLNAIVPSSNGGLVQPGGLLFQNGSLYVASQGTNQVIRYESTSGQYLDAIDVPNSGNLDRPVGLLLDPVGDLLVGSFDKIARYGTVQGTSFKVSLSSPRPQTISVDYATTNGNAISGSDYTSAIGTLTFSPGEIVKSIFVPTLDDSIYEGNETFQVVLSSPVGATTADSLAVATILDNELPPTKFYVVNDGASDRTYEYGATGTAIENYSIQSINTSPRGAASNAAGDKVWVVDANKTVYVYNTSGGLLGSWSAGSLASNATVEGVTTNGTDVWIVDSKSDKVFKYAGAASRISGSQTAVSSFALNGSNTSPTDLVTDGSSIWVLNNTLLTDKVFKYSVSGSLIGSWTISSGGGSPTGLTIDPTNVSNIWIVDNNTDRVYQFNSTASRTSGSAAPSSSFALSAGNTNPQGIADPPPSASMIDGQAPKFVSDPSIPKSQKVNPHETTTSEQFNAQVDSLFENWNEDSFFGRTNKRLAGRR